MEEAGSGHEDSSHNILTLDALQVLSRSQVTLGCQCPCGYGRYVKVYIHTYISPDSPAPISELAAGNEFVSGCAYHVPLLPMCNMGTSLRPCSGSRADHAVRHAIVKPSGCAVSMWTIMLGCDIVDFDTD
jgi:hypothetical protein